jgi:hypothetical protein
MKKIIHILLVYVIVIGCADLFAQSEDHRSPVRISMETDLVKDLPIEVVAVTAEEVLRLTFGPKPDGHFVSISSYIEHLDNNRFKITTTFSNETTFVQRDGSPGIRSVGFDDLSVFLQPGEEKVLFSSGEKRFVIGLSDCNE